MRGVYPFAGHKPILPQQKEEKPEKPAQPAQPAKPVWPPPRIEVPELVTPKTPSPTPQDDEAQPEKKVNTAKRWWGASPLKKAPPKKRPPPKREQPETVPWANVKKTLKRAERIVHKQSKFMLERPELHHVEEDDWSDTMSVGSHISISEDDRGRRFSFLMPEEGLPGSRRGSTDRGRSASPMGRRPSETVVLRPTERPQPKPVEKARIEPVELKPASERWMERPQPQPQQQQQPMVAEEGRVSPTEEEMDEASPWARGLVGQRVQYTSDTAPWATGSVQLKAVEAVEKKVFEKPQLATVELRPVPDHEDALRRRSMDAHGEPGEAPEDTPASVAAWR